MGESVTNSSPVVITAGGKRQLIVWTQESVTALEPATGKVYWRERMVTSNNDAIATPVFHKDLLAGREGGPDTGPGSGGRLTA